MKSIQHNSEQINQSLKRDGSGCFRQPPCKSSASGVAFGFRPTHAGLSPVQESPDTEAAGRPYDREEPADDVLGHSHRPDYLPEPEQTLFSTSHLRRMSGAERPLGSEATSWEAIGLSNGHNEPRTANTIANQHYTPKTASMSVALGGSLVRIKGCPLDASPDDRPNTPRGEITGFSAKSQTRMSRRVAEADESQCGSPYFVTLTYPGFYPADRSEWMRHLNAMQKRIMREYGDFIFFVWKLEPQKRGAPHFHLLLCLKGETTNDVLHQLRMFIAQAWYEVVDSRQPAHLMAGVNVQNVKSWGGVRHYCSKYMAKTFDGEQIPDWWQPGRYWGVRGIIPTDIHEVRLSQKQFYAARRLAYRHLKAVTRGSGFRPKIGSADSGVAIHWSENTALKVLAYLEAIAYDTPNGTNERETNHKRYRSIDGKRDPASRHSSQASGDAPHPVPSSLLDDRVARS